jgi:hypothetical protein
MKGMVNDGSERKICQPRELITVDGSEQIRRPAIPWFSLGGQMQRFVE